MYVHPEERDVLLEQIAKYRYMEGYRREMRTRRGKAIVTMVSTRLLDYEGQPCLLSVLRDVTERARLRQEMEDFAYSASHDLQAPLRTFEGYARWLLEDYGEVLDDMGRQLCEEIIADALHMKKLLDGLLEYSRIGRQHTEAVAVDVRKVIDRVLHDFQLEIIDTGATIYAPATLPTVYYPEVRLTQIFSNLLSNALKFTAGRAPVVTIDCEELARYYRFSVRDNGIGIAPEHFGRIFEIFKRLHTREEYPGTGAGLTIVKKIVESHGGQIGVESTLGEGSTFWFTVSKTEDAPCAN
jgi:two-component system, chemotaxis family, sensor kinase Cph1